MAEINLLPAGIRREHPPRQVQSLYLDTHEMDALQDNLAGNTEKEKLRFRWYGTETESVQGSIERKIRINGMGWKYQLPVDQKLAVTGVSKKKFMACLQDHLTPQWRTLLDPGMEPSHWITYRREYLITADSQVRLTIDHHIMSANQLFCSRLSAPSLNTYSGLTIVECKAAYSKRPALQALINEFPMAVEKCSKYALTATHDPAFGNLILPV